MRFLQFTTVIKKNEDFVHIIKKGKWFSGDFLSVYLLPNEGQENKIGIVVSKKYAKSSVRRNRIKRLMKEVYRLHEKELKVGFSLIFLWKNKNEVREYHFNELEKDILKCLKKADLFKIEEECHV